MPREVTSELLECLRRENAVTWEDENEDKSLTAYAQRGMDYLDGRARAKLDYSEGTQARMLLVAYVLYSRSHALDEFPVNYRADLIALQMATARGESKLAEDGE